MLDRGFGEENVDGYKWAQWRRSRGGLSKDFITTWRTTGANEVITIPTDGSGYNYDIKTSDGQVFTGVTGDQAITFTTPGDYDVNISGLFPTIYINNSADDLKLIYIKQFGNIVWASFERSFLGSENLVGSFTDAPNLSGVTDLSLCFYNCVSFNANINDWDVSNVENMNLMFFRALQFNGDISSWDVGNVTNMNTMFFGAQTFNQDISNWNVGNVIDMQNIFYLASNFDQNLANWDIVNVTNFNNFMSGVTLSTANYDALLIGWEATLQGTYPNGAGYNPTISISFGSSQYTSLGAVASARLSLIANFNWTITDGGIA